MGANIDLMPLPIYKKLGLGEPKPTTMWLLMDDRTLMRPIVILDDVLVKVEFRLKNEEETFNIWRSMKNRGEIQTVCAISYRVKSIYEVQI